MKNLKRLATMLMILLLLCGTAAADGEPLKILHVNVNMDGLMQVLLYSSTVPSPANLRIKLDGDEKPFGSVLPIHDVASTINTSWVFVVDVKKVSDDNAINRIKGIVQSISNSAMGQNDTVDIVLTANTDPSLVTKASIPLNKVVKSNNEEYLNELIDNALKVVGSNSNPRTCIVAISNEIDAAYSQMISDKLRSSGVTFYGITYKTKSGDYFNGAKDAENRVLETYANNSVGGLAFDVINNDDVTNKDKILSMATYENKFYVLTLAGPYAKASPTTITAELQRNINGNVVSSTMNLPFNTTLPTPLPSPTLAPTPTPTPTPNWPFPNIPISTEIQVSCMVVLLSLIMAIVVLLTQKSKAAKDASDKIISVDEDSRKSPQSVLDDDDPPPLYPRQNGAPPYPATSWQYSQTDSQSISQATPNYQPGQQSYPQNIPPQYRQSMPQQGSSGMMPKVLVTLTPIGAADRQVFKAEMRGELTVGRDSKYSQLCIRNGDMKISRLQFSLKYDGTNMYIKDENSTHGTRYMGNRISTMPIHRNDELQVGDTRLRINWQQIQ